MLRSAVAVLLVVGVAMGARVKTSKLESEPAAPVSGQHSGWQQPHHQQPEHHGWEQPKQHGWEQQQHHEPEHRGWEQPKHDGWQQPEHHGWEQPKQHGWEEPKHDGWQQPEHHGWEQPKQHGWEQPKHRGWEQPKHRGWEQPKSGWEQPKEGWHEPQHYSWSTGWEPGAPLCCEEFSLYDYLEIDAVEGTLTLELIEVRKASNVAHQGRDTLVNSELFVEEDIEDSNNRGWFNGPRTYLKSVGRYIADESTLPPASCQHEAMLIHAQYLFRECLPEEEGELRSQQWGGGSNGRWSQQGPDAIPLLSSAHVSTGMIHTKRSSSWGGWGFESCCTEYPEGSIVGGTGIFHFVPQGLPTGVVAAPGSADIVRVRTEVIHTEHRDGEEVTYYRHSFIAHQEDIPAPLK